MSKKRVLYFDILNICACISVIFLHCNGIAHTYSDTLAWKQALCVEVFCYWAVPIFFMLSGATLMNYREKYNTSEFFKKRFSRTVVPFLVWSVVNVFIKHIDVTGWGLQTWLNNIFLTQIENVYWFFIPLFAMYLAMPVLNILTDEKHRSILWYMVGVAFVTQAFLPVVFSQVGLSFNGALSFPLTGSYIIFVLLGYLLSTETLKKEHRYIIYAVGLLSGIFRYISTYLLSTSAGIIDKTFFGYAQFHSVFLSVAVFIFFKEINWSKIFDTEKKSKLLSTVSACSFGIYLIHMIIYRFLAFEVGINSNCWQWRLLAPFLIYFIGLANTLIMKRIPLIKKMVP